MVIASSSTRWRVSLKRLNIRRVIKGDLQMGNIMDLLRSAILVVSAALIALPVVAAGAELSVYAPGGVRSALQGAATVFEKETGHTVKFFFGTGGGIQKQVAAGAPADVTVLPSKGVTELEKGGLVLPGTRVEVGSVGVGVGIKAGKPRPRIATVEEFRDTLLAAKSITYADPARGGTSGTYFAQVVLPRLGIVEQMRSRTALTGVGEDAVRRVVNEESELVVVQSSEITAVPGAELVGPLPKSIQSDIPYAAVVLKTSKIPEFAVAFVRYLASPKGKVAFKTAGFELPPGR
jgi:molybdate transport system substrate-binding protein